MSKSGPVTSEEVKAAQAVLRQAQVCGVADSDPPSGSMHDSAKRLRAEGLDYEDWEQVLYEEKQKSLGEERIESGIPKAQLPIMPSSSQHGSSKMELPPGVSCIADWGSTVCKLPRVAKFRHSYMELTNIPEFHSYLVWVKQHGVGKGGRFEDFSKYLVAIKFGEASNKGSGYHEFACFPGSSDIREQK